MQPAIAVPAIALLLLRAWWKRSLTPLGLVVAGATATVHALHPWPVFFALLGVFFIGGTAVTGVKRREKARLTQSSTGGGAGSVSQADGKAGGKNDGDSGGGEGPRNHIQVLANSAVASVLIGLHAWQLERRAHEQSQNKTGGFFLSNGPPAPGCYAWGSSSDLLVVGIVAQYAAAAADTWASELGILSKRPPRLITSATLRVVPPGTNGGVTLAGTVAGLAGAMTVALTALALLPFCRPTPGRLAGLRINYGANPSGMRGGTGWGLPELCTFVAAVSIWGALGSLLDSILGATLQATVVDARTGRVIEGPGGRRVPVEAHVPTTRTKGKERPSLSASASLSSSSSSFAAASPSRKTVSGLGLLDNNGVNFVTSLSMALGAMAAAGYLWDIPLEQAFS